VSQSNGRQVRFKVPKDQAKCRQATFAPLAFWRTYPKVLVIGLDEDGKRYDFASPGYGPNDGAEIASLLRQIASGIEEDIQRAHLAEHGITPEELEARAQYKPGTRVKVMVWSGHKDVAGQVGEALMLSEHQPTATPTYDVNVGNKVVQVSQDDLMEA